MCQVIPLVFTAWRALQLGASLYLYGHPQNFAFNDMFTSRVVGFKIVVTDMYLHLYDRGEILSYGV